METREYSNPQEAYDIMNQWTQIKTSYETQFQGKNVTKVDIIFEGDRPRFAFLHYTKGFHVGSDSIDLSQKMLLDQPEKSTLVSKLIIKSDFLSLHLIELRNLNENNRN